MTNTTQNMAYQAQVKDVQEVLVHMIDNLMEGMILSVGMTGYTVKGSVADAAQLTSTMDTLQAKFVQELVEGTFTEKGIKKVSDDTLYRLTLELKEIVRPTINLLMAAIDEDSFENKMMDKQWTIKSKLDVTKVKSNRINIARETAEAIIGGVESLYTIYQFSCNVMHRLLVEKGLTVPGMDQLLSNRLVMDVDWSDFGIDIVETYAMDRAFKDGHMYHHEVGRIKFIMKTILAVVSGVQANCRAANLSELFWQQLSNDTRQMVQRVNMIVAGTALLGANLKGKKLNMQKVFALIHQGEATIEQFGKTCPSLYKTAVTHPDYRKAKEERMAAAREKGEVVIDRKGRGEAFDLGIFAEYLMTMYEYYIETFRWKLVATQDKT